MRSTLFIDEMTLNDESIKYLIAQSSNTREITNGLYTRYKNKELEILTRPVSDVTKPNNKLPHDYRGYIVNQAVGYLFGQPISYSLDKVAYEKSLAEYETHSEYLTRFTIINHIDDLDSELAKLMSICGYAGRLLYIENGTGESKAMNIPPWECTFLENDAGQYAAFRYYTRSRLLNGKAVPYGVFEYYDNKKIYKFEENKKGVYEQKSDADHLFSIKPFILFQNNEEEVGDFEYVEPLINAYDKITSDGVNEIESFAHAYMLFKGVGIDDELVKEMKKTGGIEVDENGDVKFITKDINGNFMETMLNRLQTDIHKFSASVDMSDEKFSGSAQTGESRKWKLLDLENKAGTKARKFSKSLRKQFEVLCTAWSKRMAIDYINIFWEFKRNIPNDLVYIGDFAQKMNGVHSTRTLLGQIPYVDDVDYELRLIEQERLLFNEQMEKLEPIDYETSTKEDEGAVADED